MVKKFQVLSTTEGCATNLLENATYRKALSKNGWHESSLDEADVIVLNTCGHTQEREDHTIKTLGQIKEKYPTKEVVVGGCLAKINPASFDGLYEGKFFSPGRTDELFSSLNVVPNLIDMAGQNNESNFFDARDFTRLTALHKLVIYLRPLFFRLEKMVDIEFQPLHNIFETVVVNEDFFGITVGEGCAGKCTFCAIKVAKGHIKSKSTEQIQKELVNGLSSGKDKIWLLGDDIGCYGIDLGKNVVHLLECVLSLKDEFQLVINYFEPMFLVKHFGELEDYFADRRVVNVNIPIQSGSGRVVELMGRDYDPGTVLACIKKIKKLNPNVVIKNNIIVGFPGETFKDFLKSIKTVFYYDATLAIPFASRPGTRAAKMDHQIPEFQKKVWFIIINCFIFLKNIQVVAKSITNGLLKKIGFKERSL